MKNLISILGCPAAVTKCDIYLSWAKFSSKYFKLTGSIDKSLCLPDLDLSQPVEASFSQSEEVFYRSHIMLVAKSKQKLFVEYDL